MENKINETEAQFVARLMAPRYLVSNVGYPNMPFAPGSVVALDRFYLEEPAVKVDITFYPKSVFDRFSNIFSPLAWWQFLSWDDFFAIKYAWVVEYVGYWRVGDIVPVKGYHAHLNNPTPRPLGLLLGDHMHPLTKVRPATKEQYDKWKANKDKP